MTNYIDNLELESGDELHFDDGSVWEITSFDHDEDMVNVRRLDDDRRGANDRDSWTAESIQSALVHGEAETDDGRSTEAVKHF